MRYALTQSGRLMFVSSHESALEQNQKSPVLEQETSNDAEKSLLTQN